MPPDGESVTAVGERAAGAFERAAEGLAPGTLAVIVSHGAAIGTGLSRLLGLPEQDRVLGALSNCCWSVVGRRGGRWRLLEHNVGRSEPGRTGGSGSFQYTGGARGRRLWCPAGHAPPGALVCAGSGVESHSSITRGIIRTLFLELCGAR
jgi:hypothetical protein